MLVKGRPKKRLMVQVLLLLAGGYQGYRWTVVINDLNPNALKPHTFGLHVLIKHAQCSADIPWLQSGQIDMSALRQADGYCGSNAGFNTMDPDTARDRVSDHWDGV